MLASSVVTHPSVVLHPILDLAHFYLRLVALEELQEWGIRADPLRPVEMHQLFVRWMLLRKNNQLPDWLGERRRFEQILLARSPLRTV